MYFLLTSVLNKKTKKFSFAFYDVIIRRCKIFVSSHDFSGRGLFSWITALLDNQMDKFVTRIPSSARSSSIAASCFPLSSRSAPNTNSRLASATSSFSSQKHQDRLPDGCRLSSFEPILPKNFSPPLQKNLPLLAFSSGCGLAARAGRKGTPLLSRHC